GALFTAPNYFGESPALQVTTGKTTVNITSATSGLVEDALKRNGVPPSTIAMAATRNRTALRARFASTDAQFKAKLAPESERNGDKENPDYSVTVNPAKNTPAWMESIGAKPMNLGLDLRGGVPCLLQI